MVLNPILLFSLLNLIIFNNFIVKAKMANSDSSISQSLIIANSKEDRAFKKELQLLLGKYINPILKGLFSRDGTLQCIKDFNFIFESLPLGGEWPIKMLDSFGKPESGVLNGNVRWLGEFDECLQIYAPPKNGSGAGGFHGQYCSLQVNVEIPGRSLPLSMGLCLPDSCKISAMNTSFFSYQNIKEMFPDISDKFTSVFSDVKFSCQPAPKSLTAGAISVIILISVFVLLAVIGSSITIYEYFMEVNTKDTSIANSAEMLNGSVDATSATEKRYSLPRWLEKSKDFFSCFCLLTNGERIVNVDSAEGQLPCLHGIRFLSMSWVILGHTYAICFPALRNTVEAVKLIDRWTLQIIFNGFYSVDSFFLLSAFLVGHLFFKQCAKSNGKIPWLYFYLHRYIRLTPVYMILVAFYTTLNSYLGSGPIWPDASANTDPDCDVGWWWNLLYINNFKPDMRKCMAWTWYLANDMQFYIISPLFLVTLFRWPKIGYSVTALFFCIAYIASFVLTYEYKLLNGFNNISAAVSNINEFFPRWYEYFAKFYIKPYTRLDPYLIGIVLAYYIYKRKENNAGKLSLLVLSVGWGVAAGITLTCLFGLYHQTPSLVASSFYNAFNRSGFACGLAWVMFVCITEQGGVVNRILSWKLWIPLSRLTFCAYLVHPMIQLVYFSSVRRLIHFSHTIIVIHYLGFLMFSYAAALLVSLLFESPVIRLEKLMRNKFTS